MTATLLCQASDPQWLELRRTGVTATDITVIAGLVTWDSPWALYHRKLGLLPERDQTDRMRLGSWLESRLVVQWHQEHGGELRGAGLFRSDARPWQLATPDACTGRWCPTPAGPDYSWAVAVLECKTSATRQGWGDDGTDQVPAHVRAQVLWQMDTLGVGTGHVAVVFLPSGEFRSYTLAHDGAGCMGDPDKKTCKLCREVDGLRDLGFGFWSRILTRRPPDLDGLEVTAAALRALHPAPGGTVEIDDDELLYRFDLAVAFKRDAETELRLRQAQVREFMGDASEATLDGRVVFRRTIGKRAGYTVPPGETDTLRRVGKDKTDD